MGVFTEKLNNSFFMLTLVNFGSIQHMQEFDYCRNWQYQQGTLDMWYIVDAGSCGVSHSCLTIVKIGSRI